MKLFISKLHYKKELSVYEKIILILLKVVAFFYGLIIKSRNKLYDLKILPSYTSKSFVISIGNLTTGGVGKTPLAKETAEYYLGQNKRVAILSRGYGAKLNNKEPHLISDGSGALFKASVAGDEPVWLAENVKGAYVVTCRDRVKAEKYVREKYNPEIIILDDGFQHRKINRDLNILLVDSKYKFGNKNILPAGPLREELSNIVRADKVVVVNKSYDSKNALKYCDYLKNKYKKDTFLCKIVPEYAYDIYNDEKLEKGARIMAFSAIGQSKGFYDFLKHDYKLSAVLEFEDHHNYVKDDISKIIHYAQDDGIEHLVTTEKDAVKILEITDNVELPVKIFALKLKAFVDIKDICGI